MPVGSVTVSSVWMKNPLECFQFEGMESVGRSDSRTVDRILVYEGLSSLQCS